MLDFSHHSHALVTLQVQFLCSDWSKMWQVSSCGKFLQHLETCLLIAEADRVLCHLGMFLTVFFLLDVQNEIQLLSRFFCNSWLVCLLRFWLRNAPLVKVTGNPISDASFSKMSLFTCPCLRRKRVEKYQAILSPLDGPQEQHLDSAVDWYAWAIIVFDVFCSGF